MDEINIPQYLASLQGLHQSDANTHTAYCPACQGEGALIITAGNDGDFSAKCKDGCTAEAISRALDFLGIPYMPDGSGGISFLNMAVQQSRKSQGRRKRRTGATKTDVAALVEILGEVELFHSPEKEAFATILVGDHRETYPVRSKAFSIFVRRQLHSKGGAARPAVVTQVVECLEARALFDGQEQQAYIRIAGYEGKIYLDLCNEKWEAVEITTAGWRVVAEPPVKFRRAKGMLPLPYPVQGGSVSELRDYLNVGSEGDFVLVVSWIISAFRPIGPYPTLILAGEQGSAKSTFSRTCRALLDPSTAPLRPLPRDERDLSISAFNSWVLTFDNLSWITARMADALCRMATGGGFATRELYSDREETLFDGARPVILNGIEPLAERPDLADRSILMELPPIPMDRRMTEQEFWRKFDHARPRILGALLDAVSAALRNQPDVKLESTPRMADFAVWSVAAEPALPWPTGSFLKAYDANRADMAQATLDNDLLSNLLSNYLQSIHNGNDTQATEFQGTAQTLHKTLLLTYSEQIARLPEWPKSPAKLSARLHRLAPALRAIGIEVQFKKSNGRRLVQMRRLPEHANFIDPVGPVLKPTAQRLVN